jgi:predicted enzyme related to lactoylglutathione lyase
MVATILNHGGTIVVKPIEIPTVGVLVKFADTEGNIAHAIQYFKKG